MVRLRSPQVPQKGFSTVLVIVGVVLILFSAGFFFFKKNPKNQESVQPFLSRSDSSKTDNSKSIKSSDEPPLKLKSIGVNLGYFDPVTNKAGDFVFTRQKMQFNRLFMDYGFFIPASSASPDKKNPQPTFILPLGTPVRSLVDGVVAQMPTLWSGDISVQVTTDGKLQRWVYEVEHVKNPKVKVGDKVTAGQIIAEVSDFDNGAAGFGAVEIGILHGGGDGPPEHVCPFLFLDDSIKEDTLAKMKAFFKSWEEYIGDQTLYPENYQVPGCLTLDPIEG